MKTTWKRTENKLVTVQEDLEKVQGLFKTKVGQLKTAEMFVAWQCSIRSRC